MKRLRILAWPLLVGVLTLTPAALSQSPSRYKPGDQAPNFKTRLLDGGSFQLKEHRGKVVVLNFWFMACPPCLLEMPELNELVTHFEGKPVVFLAPTPDTSKELREFLKVRQFKYQIAPNGTPVADVFGVEAAPVHIVINPEGRIHWVKYGVISDIEDEMIRPIEQLLAK